jgi:hypothetical protein
MKQQDEKNEFNKQYQYSKKELSIEASVYGVNNFIQKPSTARRIPV